MVLSFLHDVVTSVPVVGHGIGLGYKIAGEEDAAKKAFRSCNRTSAVIGGGMVAGPAGAIGALALNDCVDTTVDLATGEHKKEGYVAAGINGSTKKVVSGEDIIGGVVEGALDIGGAYYGGKGVADTVKKGGKTAVLNEVFDKKCINKAVESNFCTDMTIKNGVKVAKNVNKLKKGPKPSPASTLLENKLDDLKQIT